MPVTLADEEWGKIVVAFTTMTNGFHSMTAAASVTSKAAEQMVEVIEAVNERLKAEQPQNRAERRAAR